jgi:predicted GH43/DUF377 family glycosyl hydrolase
VTTTTVVPTASTVPPTTTTSAVPYPYDFGVHSEAPVLKPQTWHSAWTAVPWVIVENGTWNLFYSGSKSGLGSLGWATSTDGINWEKETLLTPLLPPGGGLGWFFIFQTDTNWEMLHVQGFSPPYRKVQRATAPAFEGPWEDQGEAFKAPDREWDKFIVPTGVTKVEDRYLMPYAGWGQQNRVPAVGILSSNDGLSWEPLFEEPIHVATEDAWDEMGVVPMNIIAIDKGLELFFMGYSEPPKVGYQKDVIPFGRLVGGPRRRALPDLSG